MSRKDELDEEYESIRNYYDESSEFRKNRILEEIEKAKNSGFYYNRSSGLITYDPDWNKKEEE